MDTQFHYQDIIDSRDIIDRIEELEEIDRLEGDSDPSEHDQLVELKELQSECEEISPDWEYGVTLIEYTYFTEYIKELVEDCYMGHGQMPDFVAIDWERTAETCKIDYTEVECFGSTYYIR